jgi:hypothetical protein
MMRSFARGGLLACALVLSSSLAIDATPGFWQSATQADFLRGEVEQLSIDEHGRLMLGPEVQRVADPSVPFVWTLLPAEDGGYFLGTGNDGRVLRIDKSGTSSVFFDSTEMEVHALAPAPNGGVYVGTSPDGRVYKVDARGQATPFFDPEDKYIWSLAVDAKGIVYVGTGDKGTVYRITPDGKGEAFFPTKTTHATALAVDRSGQLLVGTGSPGRVFRVDAAGKGFLLLDTTYQEIKTLRLDAKGVLFVAAQSGRGAGDSSADPTTTTDAPHPPAVPNVSTEITSFAIIDVPVTPQPTPPAPAPSERRGPTGAIYRVLPNGLWDQVWESRDDAPYDVAFEADGALLVATGGRGKIFRLAGDPLRPTLLTRLAAQQATMLHRAEGRTFVATANPGRLLALSAARAERGTYESEVRDARMVATWGTLSWRAALPAGTRVELATRSGNTRTPDEAWSEWSPAYTDADGSAITSPNARYLQWRAVLTGKGDSPILTSVTAAYQQRNVRPEIESITVHPPGVVFQKPFSTGEAEIAGFDDDTVEKRMASSTAQGGSTTTTAPALGRRTYQKGLQTFVWKAEDANGDELTYDVLYRREGETSWKLLKSALVDSILVWDTSSAPNGSYVLKVMASDAKSNPAETALRGERESASFEIDNSPPTVTLATPRRDGAAIVVPFEIRDGDSPLVRVEYSLDAQRWQSAFPQDGILDSRQEQFALRLDAATAGRTLVVRATDAMNNVGSGQVVVK